MVTVKDQQITLREAPEVLLLLFSSSLKDKVRAAERKGLEEQ